MALLKVVIASHLIYTLCGASPDIFNASKFKCSLGNKLLSRFLEHCDGDAWPHPSPQASLLILEAWYLLRSFRGKWGNLQHAWRSLLAMPGWVLYHRTDKIGYLVLQSSRYSCVTHPLSRVGLLYQTRGRGRCDSRRSTLAATSLNGIG